MCLFSCEGLNRHIRHLPSDPTHLISDVRFDKAISYLDEIFGTSRFDWLEAICNIEIDRIADLVNFRITILSDPNASSDVSFLFSGLVHIAQRLERWDNPNAPLGNARRQGDCFSAEFASREL